VDQRTVGSQEKTIAREIKMRTEKEVRDMLNLLVRDDELHTIVIRDVGIEEIKTAKDILTWVLEENKESKW